MNAVPILMYHALETDEHPAGAVDSGEQLYVLPVDTFRAQMEYLSRNGFQVLLLKELCSAKEWPEKGVVLTFDDGHQSNFTLALPILQSFGFRADFFVTTDWIGTSHFMTQEEIRGLSAAGMGIGSHGKSHRFLDDLSTSDVEIELQSSKALLEKITGTAIETFSCPGGRKNKATLPLAQRTGYALVCSSEPLACKALPANGFLPRIALHNDISIAQFASVLQDDRRLARIGRYWVLRFLKILLGNHLYCFVRDLISRRLHKAPSSTRLETP